MSCDFFSSSYVRVNLQSARNAARKRGERITMTSGQIQDVLLNEVKNMSLQGKETFVLTP